MIQKGNVVIVNKPELNIWDEEMIIVETMISDEYAYYVGNDAIVVDDKNGNNLVETYEEYHLKDNSSNKVVDNVTVEDEIKKFDVITLKERDGGTQRLFYQVINNHKSGVSFIDDTGNKRTYPRNQVEEVTLNNWFDYFNRLQQEIYDLREFTSQAIELVMDDMQNMLKKFKS